MSQFDPYHKWLGIPASEQPPNHYRLLGLTLFESDPDVIESAADKQMAHVRTFQAGAHSADSQRLLNKLAAAKLCLLSPTGKAAYDAGLGLKQSRPLNEPLAMELPLVTVADRRHAPPQEPGKYRPPEARWLMIAVSFVIVAVVVIVMYRRREASPHEALQDERSVAEAKTRVQTDVTKKVVAGRTKNRTEKRAKVTASAHIEQRTTKPPSLVVAPKILQTKTSVFNQDGNDSARYDGQVFAVGLIGGIGFAAVGYELEGAQRVELEVNVLGNVKADSVSPVNSFLGFIIDYRTTAGYSRRLALSLGLSSTERDSRGPPWGKESVPDRFIDIPIGEAKHLDLSRWAPDDWDGRAWLSAVIQNSGANTSLDGRITKLVAR